jgi:hypothetical protein
MKKSVKMEIKCWILVDMYIYSKDYDANDVPITKLVFV